MFVTLTLIQIHGVLLSNRTEMATATRCQEIVFKKAHTDVLSWNFIVDEWILTSCDNHAIYNIKRTESNYLESAVIVALLVGMVVITAQACE